MYRRTSFRVFLVSVAVAISQGLPGAVAPAALSLAGPSRAEADEFIGDRPFTGPRRNFELNFHMSSYFGYDGYIGFHRNRGYGSFAFGPGFDMLFPIVQNGFIRSINNAFYLGFFVDPIFHPSNNNNNRDDFLSLSVGVFAQWRFFLFRLFDGGDFAVFANLGAAAWPWFWDSFGNCRDCGVGFTAAPVVQIGAIINFTRHVGLRFVVGHPSVNVGLTIGF